MSGSSHADCIATIIRNALAEVKGTGKLGDRVIDPALSAALAGGGYDIDRKDRRGILSRGLPVWRDKATGAIVPTPARREIDIVAYFGSVPVALVEIESDLDDLRVSGISTRSGHYDVYSIARRGDGQYFDSYNSLERMAVSATVLSLRARGVPATNDSVTALLASLASDDPAIHNPLGLPLILAVGEARRSDPTILAPRLRALGATLMVRRFR